MMPAACHFQGSSEPWLFGHGAVKVSVSRDRVAKQRRHRMPATCPSRLAYRQGYVLEQADEEGPRDFPRLPHATVFTDRA